MYQDVSVIGCHPKAPKKDKHSEVEKKNPPMIGSRGNGQRPACYSMRDGYVRGRTSGKIMTNNP